MIKRVAHTSLYYFELSENWIHTQLKYLSDWQPIVFTNKTKNLNSERWQPPIYERRRELPIGIYQLDSILMKLIGYYPSFYRQAKKSQVPLIHAHFGPMGFLSIGIARKLGVPLVTTFYGYDASELPRQFPSWQEDYKTLFKEGTRFLVEGPAMGKKLEALGCPAEKITIQHLGVEFETFPARKNYHTDGPVRFLMAGRFVEKKGFIYGLQAFRAFLQQGGNGVLTIVGDANATSESKRLKQQMYDYVQKYQLGDKVTFTGLIPLDQLKEQYYQHDIFVAPSVQAANGDNEGGLPVTIIEAAAAGMALIGSRHCDISEVIRPDQTGFLANEKDTDQLAAHMKKMADEPALIRQMGEQARALIQQEYNAKVQGQRLAQIYDGLLELSSR